MWAHMMPNRVLIAPPSTPNDYGEETFGTDTEYKCRLVYRRRMVRNRHGDEVVSDKHVILGDSPLIDPRSRVTLSTSDVGSTESIFLSPKILTVERLPDETGWHHTKIFF